MKALISNCHTFSAVFICSLVFLSLSSPNALSEKKNNGQPGVKALFDNQVLRAMSDKIKLETMKQRIEEKLNPATLINKFVDEFRKSCKNSDPQEAGNAILDYLSKNKTLKQGTGSISGEFIIPTDWMNGVTTVLAFDSYGYIAGVGTADSYYRYKRYKIENLPPGDYYLITVSWRYAYVDQIYDSLPAPAFTLEKWRTATKVNVKENTITENINFKLQPSAEFLLTLYKSDGATISEEYDATFTLTDYDKPVKRIEALYEYYNKEGEFRFFIPFTGDFKLGVSTSNRPVTWYKNSSQWDSAGKISISGFSSKKDSLGIILNQTANVSQLGKISGIVTGTGNFKLIFAFKTDDLSLSGLGLSFGSFYQIEDLPAGEYYVYAEDYLGKNGSSLQGTFYKNAGNISEAEKVVVGEGKTTIGINISLRKGASIKGNISDEDNKPLAEMLIAAISTSAPEASAFNLFTQMRAELAITDSSGNYTITGLTPGDYILRTLSGYTLKMVWGFPSLPPGPLKGQVVDEFYKGVYSLFDFAKSQKITVQDTLTTDKIDFRLQKAKFIKGRLYDAQTNEPVAKAMMIACIDSSLQPFYAIPKIEENGTYQLGPLPSGKYRLLAAAAHEQKDFFLPEFYDNVYKIEDAKVLDIAGQDLEKIDIGFDRSAIIQGHINLAAGTDYYPAGDDTLSGFPVVLYNAADGSFARNAYVQFNGGFRIPRLLPGSYKMAALPIGSDYSSAYYGGGKSFDDAASKVIEVKSGQLLELNITLFEKGANTIEGHVSDKTSGEPVANCLVFAYDGTGHAAGIGITDSSSRGIVKEGTSGMYKITGLRAGNYFLSTYAFSDEKKIAETIPQEFMKENSDLLSVAISLLGIMLTSNTNLYSDSWYNNIPLQTELNITGLAVSLLIHGIANEYDHARYPFFMMLPFQRPVPANVSPVILDGGNTTLENIDFQLEVGNIKDLLVYVNPEKDKPSLPDKYILYSNYPNPFNGITVIKYSIPERSHVTLKIYDILGNETATPINKEQNAGEYDLQFNASQLSSGIYFYRINAGQFIGTKKMLLLK